MKRTTSILILILVGTTLFANGAGSSIKIAVVGAHSGDLASYGIPTVKAAEIVVEDWNARGGVLGKKIELIVEDDVCKALAANKLPGKGYRFCRHLNRFVKQPILRKNRVSNIIILNALAQLWK